MRASVSSLSSQTEQASRAGARIRPARPADLDALVLLLCDLFSIEEDFEVDAVRQRRGLAAMLANVGCCVLVAEADGRVVGMCTGQLIISTAEGGPALLVEDVIVEKKWRGRGIGSRLLEELADWGRTRKACRLQLLADRSNGPALLFYQKLGWQSTGLICLRKRQQGAAFTMR